jgi:hypothetical protein
MGDRMDAGRGKYLGPGAFDTHSGARLGIPVADEIAPDGRADDTLFCREVQMVQVARL